MKRWAIVGLILGLAACGEAAPQGWNANLDAQCRPHDPVDKLSALLSPEDFWRQQEYDMGTLLKAGQTNRDLSQTVLDDSRAQQGDYFNRAQQAARELGLSGQAAREHVQENMDRFRDEMKTLETRLAGTIAAIVWVQRCQQTVTAELTKLGLSPVPFQSENRP